MSNGKQLANNANMLPLSHIYTHTEHSITSCMAPSCNMNFHLFSSLGGMSQEKFWGANVLLMDRVNSPGLFLLHKHACWTHTQQWDTFFLFNSSKKRCLVPVALVICICSPHERMHLLLIYFSTCSMFLHSSPLFFRPYGTCTHLPVFCFSITRSSPFIHPSVSLCLLQLCMHPSVIAFLILLTGDNIYVLFFNIHFAWSYRP